MWIGPFAGCILATRETFNPSFEPTFGEFPVTTCDAELLVPPYIDLGGPQQLVNISTRSHVGPDGDVVIAGFVVHENLPKRYLIRAVGPSLEQFGVADALADPMLQVYQAVHDGNVLVGKNDNWRVNPDEVDAIVAATEEAGAFPLAAAADAVVYFSALETGVHTVQMAAPARSSLKSINWDTDGFTVDGLRRF